MKEVRRVVLHMRLALQMYIALGFSFALMLTVPPLGQWRMVAVGFVAWFLLCTGITLYNSYYDRDQGPVMGLAKPPPINETIYWVGVGMKAVALLLGFLLNLQFFFLTIVGATLSVLYSHPIARCKGRPIMSLVFNFIAGACTFLALLQLVPNTERLIALVGTICAGLFLVSTYLLMQIHQIDEDRERGDASFSVRYGATAAISVAFACFAAAGLATTYLLVETNRSTSLLLLGGYALLGSAIVYLRRSTLTEYVTLNEITQYLSWAGTATFLLGYLLA